MHPIDALIQVAAAARKIRDYLATQVGETDDWPCEICFDSDKEASKFTRIVQKLDLALDDLDETTLN